MTDCWDAEAHDNPNLYCVTCGWTSDRLRTVAVGVAGEACAVARPGANERWHEAPPVEVTVLADCAWCGGPVWSDDSWFKPPGGQVQHVAHLGEAINALSGL
jgi:hypothetical protein